MSEQKLPLWTARCARHGLIEIHQETAPTRCHRRLGNRPCHCRIRDVQRHLETKPSKTR